MKYQFAKLTVTVSILLCVISIPLPYRRDTAIHFKNCDKKIPHVVVVNKTDGKILNCHKCIQCQLGHGLTMPCNGQNVTLAELHIECEPCVAGVNYSTAESIQCQPCVPKFCKDGVQTLGMCESDGDKRTCQYCELKDWYFNETERTCKPCSCQNMTDEIKRICIGLGFQYDKQCDQEPITTNNTPSVLHTHKENIWDLKYSILVGCCGGIALIAGVFCIIRVMNVKVNHPRLTACSKEWCSQIFSFKGTTRSRPDEAQHGSGRTVHYVRQNSCPVTENEKFLANRDLHAPLRQDDSQEKDGLIVALPDIEETLECKQRNLKFFDMNSETCRQICAALRSNVETGMGYLTLAGYMDFSANKVKEFKEENVCEEMLSCWSHLDTKENTVLKLKELVVKLKRDDILDLIEKELKKKKMECKCSECSASS